VRFFSSFGEQFFPTQFGSGFGGNGISCLSISSFEVTPGLGFMGNKGSGSSSDGISGNGGCGFGGGGTGSVLFFLGLGIVLGIKIAKMI
jgi:hypothetical protein